MSKRKRTDFEEGIQSAAGTKYGDNGSKSLPQSLSYDDEDTGHEETPTTPPGPYSYAAERRQALSGRNSVEDDYERTAPGPRSREHGESSEKKPQMNPLFGQKGAFPEPESYAGDQDDASDGFDAEEAGAWEYLRSVRAEAEGLPSFFRERAIAMSTDGRPNLEADTKLQGDDHITTMTASQRLLYADGAVVAPPLATQHGISHATSPAQAAYYQALLSRFTTHKNRSRKAAKMVVGGSNSQAEVRRCLAALEALEEPPAKAVVRLDPAAVLRAIELLDAKLDDCLGARRLPLPGVLGRWAWTLLALLPDVGMLSSSEVGRVRDLAKRAAWGMGVMRMAAAGNGHGRGVGVREGSGAGSTATDGEDRVAAGPSETGPGEEVEGMSQGHSTMATLYLIVTVVGEVFGQRDLLDSRLPWT